MLEDVLDHGLRIVFCGTAAGDKSARLSQYYAGPGNKFWRTLAAVGLTPRILHPSEYRSVLTYGLGLTDIVKGQSGSDSLIQFGAAGPDLVRSKIEEYQPLFLCFNGKRAAQEFLAVRAVEFGELDEHVGATRLYVAPSTSGAANGYWDVIWWQRLARLAGSGSA